MPYMIREYNERDRPAFRQCVVALQDFERTIDTRLRPGDTMADAYCEQIHRRCLEAQGRVFVAEHDGTAIGFVAVHAHEPFTELDQPPGTFGLIAELIVLGPHRQKGVGRSLLDRAEQYAREAGAVELRIGVLARNDSARRLYLNVAFAPYSEILAKKL
jgi:GNAT superfamily N-acetyltransferase